MGTSLNVAAWSTTAASNNSSDTGLPTVADTMTPTQLDDTLRGIMAAVKRYVLDTDGGITAGGSADALTITTNRVISTGHQAAGFSIRFKAGGTNTGAATVAVDGLTAASIKRINGDALSAGDIVSGGIYDLSFDGTNYILMGAGTGSGTYGTLSGSNTWSGANVFTSSVTVGNGSGDVVVIKGTTVNANISALFSSATVATFTGTLLDALSSSSTVPVGYVVATAANTWRFQTIATTADHLLDSLGTETTGALLYHNGSVWTTLAPP